MKLFFMELISDFSMKMVTFCETSAVSKDL